MNEFICHSLEEAGNNTARRRTGIRITEAVPLVHLKFKNTIEILLLQDIQSNESPAFFNPMAIGS